MHLTICVTTAHDSSIIILIMHIKIEQFTKVYEVSNQKSIFYFIKLYSIAADHGTSYMNNSASNKAESSTHTTSIKTRPSPISTSSISLVFYITVVLISVFVISFLIYGINYLRNICISKQKLISSVTQTKNADNSLYECVDFPHHM